MVDSMRSTASVVVTLRSGEGFELTIHPAGTYPFASTSSYEGKKLILYGVLYNTP